MPAAAVPAPVTVEAGAGRVPQAWWLYLLECAGGKLYAGISPDPAARFERHRAGTGARYTRANRPIRILAVENHPDRSTASIAEHRLKQCTKAQKLQWAKARSWAEDAIAARAAG